jgi:hypothetical protein
MPEGTEMNKTKILLAASLLASCGIPTDHTALFQEQSINSPAGVTKTATRILPPDPFEGPIQPTGINGLPFAPEGLTACQEMNFYRIQFGLPDRFSDQPREPQVSFANQGLGWRESSCRNDVNTYCCYGYWQLYFDLHNRDHRTGPKYAACGVFSITDYFGNDPIQKQKQACAAKAVYDTSGLQPWVL